MFDRTLVSLLGRPLPNLLRLLALFCGHWLSLDDVTRDHRFGLLGATALRSSSVSQQEEELSSLLHYSRRNITRLASLVDQVSILAGTDNIPGGVSQGNTLPILARPWGFNHWAVQSRNSGGSWWFNPGDTSFLGLRCTHQPSPWIGDYGHFLVLPRFDESGNRGMRYDLAEATFRPYLFKANLHGAGDLSSEGIGFEAVPTMHGLAFRVTLTSSQPGAVEFQLPAGTWRKQESSSRIVGGGVPDGDRDETLWVAVESDGAASWTFQGAKALLSFPATATTMFIRLGTSFISAEQAELNLEKELGTRPWPVLQSEAHDAWEHLLKRVEVEFSDPNRSAVFYSNLYRGMLFPRFLWEFDKDGKMVHRSPFTKQVVPGHAVTDEGFWDAYRTHYPMLSLLFPDILGDIIDGWVGAYLEKGWLPAWASYNQRHSMVGTMGDCSLADAVVKSAQGLLSGFDKDRAFEAIYKDATTEPSDAEKRGQFGRIALQEYLSKGYAPSNHPDVSRFAGEQSASLTLNYNLADACAALAAEALGKSDVAEQLRERSRSFRSIFDNETKYFRAKRMNGDWDRQLDPIAWGNGFTEAAAAQYRFDAPQDVPGLVELMGGKTEFCNKVTEMFESSPDFKVGTYGTIIHEMNEARFLGSQFGLGRYAHNNQPVHHVLYVAAMGGCTSFAQKMLRRVMADLYTENGWSGDEDTGEMSSWYVLSALGLYSLVPGSDDLVLGSPEVLRATLNIPGRPLLAIQAPGNTAETVYVTGATLNRQPLGDIVKYSSLAKEGGELTFQMSSKSK